MSVCRPTRAIPGLLNLCGLSPGTGWPGSHRPQADRATAPIGLSRTGREGGSAADDGGAVDGFELLLDVHAVGQHERHRVGRLAVDVDLVMAVVAGGEA